MSAIDAMTADPDDPTTFAKKQRFMLRMVTVLVGGMFLDGYILGIIGPVAHSIEEDPSFTALWIGLEAASAMIGILIGSPIGGWLADKFGRKPILFWDLALFTVFSALQFFVPSDVPWVLFVVRLLMGLAVGIEYAVGWPMLAEFAPTAKRGRYLCYTLVAWYGGFMVAFFIGYYMDAADIRWQYILGTSTLIAFVLLLGRIGLPESPRWLWSQGRTEEAHAIVTEYLDTEYRTDMAKAASDGVRGTFKMLFSPAVWRSTVFMSVFWMCAVAPFFAIGTFADRIMGEVGLTGLLKGVIFSVAGWVGTIVTTMVIDKFSRRKLTVPTQWIASVILAVAALLIWFWTDANQWLLLVLFLAYAFLSAIYNTMTTVYPAEVFPTEVRAIGTGFAAAISRMGAAAGLFLTPEAIKVLGLGPTLLVWAFVGVVGALVSQILAPETSGKSLSELAGDVSH
ncbi:MAG: MFS transporter [Gordonia sp. (in: high G+C Gram-positive bacteria)]|uniref:MFS transporter n=1 Tax=Gordonia sp. (in: high G+C Gram-positive bacteria) TaxID=84139 RepID=UPI0039E677EC